MYKASYKYLVGMCIALFASPSFSQDIPSSLERVEPIVSEISLDSFSIATKGTSHSWVQLAWDRKKRHIRRVVFSSYDPLGDKKYDLSWVMEDGTVQADGPISGTGTLVWRKSSSKISGSSSIIATHIGSFEKGYASGKGHFIHASGFEYEGTWKDGIPHGQGRLYFANGDEYTGQFINGQPHGFGTYVDASGSVYDGGFGGGKREGTGTIYIPGKVAMTALWKEGVQLPGTSRQLIENERRFPIILANERYDEADDIEISIISDAAWARRKNEGEFKVIDYTTSSEGEILKVNIADNRLRNVWKGTANPVVQVKDINFDSNHELGLFGKVDHIVPVPFLIRVTNRSGQSIGIKESYLYVESSKLDLSPVVHIDTPETPRGNCRIDSYQNIIFLQNFGWGENTNAKVVIKFPTIDANRTDTIEDLNTHPSKIDYSELLARIGVDIDYISKEVVCKSDKNTCFSEAKARGVYGKLKNLVEVDGGGYVTAPIEGELQLSWPQNNRVATRVTKFNTVLGLGMFIGQVECGEGGDRSINRSKPFVLKSNADDYKISLPIKDTLNQRVSANWRIELKSDRSSMHQFRAVFILDDGRKIASRPIHLEYFKPKTLKYDYDKEAYVLNE